MRSLNLISRGSFRNPAEKHFKKRFRERVGRFCIQKEFLELKKGCKQGIFDFLGYSKANSKRTIFGKTIDGVRYRLIFDSKDKELVTIL